MKIVDIYIWCIYLYSYLFLISRHSRIRNSKSRDLVNWRQCHHTVKEGRSLCVVRP